MILKPGAKLALTFVLFLLAIGTVAAAAAAHKAGPLFFAWLPLLAVPWVLTRPEEVAEPPAGHVAEPAESSDPPSHRQAQDQPPA